MSSDDKHASAANKTTTRMEARELHLHVLDLVLPADWERTTPQFWTKDRDSLETYEAEIDGFTLQVELKSDELWIGRLEAPDGSKTKTDSFRSQPHAVRALVEALESHKTS